MAKTGSRQTLMEDQIARMRHFPKDRIPFYSSPVAVAMDTRAFKYYHDRYKLVGDSCVRWCITEVERANYLPPGTISPELFIKTANSLGWDPDGWEPDNE